MYDLADIPCNQMFNVACLAEGSIFTMVVRRYCPCRFSFNRSLTAEKGRRFRRRHFRFHRSQCWFNRSHVPEVGAVVLIARRRKSAWAGRCGPSGEPRRRPLSGLPAGRSVALPASAEALQRVGVASQFEIIDVSPSTIVVRLAASYPAKDDPIFKYTPELEDSASNRFLKLPTSFSAPFSGNDRAIPEHVRHERTAKFLSG
jgi:hypothetical protein